MFALLLRLLQSQYAGVGFLLAALVIYLFGNSKSRNTSSSLHPPGPRGLPVVGYWQILFKYPYDEIQKLAAKYGKIFMMRVGKYNFVVINDHQVIKDVFVKRGDIVTDRPSGTNNLHYIFDSQGLFMESGEKYKELRVFFVNAMKDLGLGTSATEVSVSKQCEIAVDYVTSLKGASFDPTYLFNCITTNIITKFVMDKEYADYNDPELKRLIYLSVHIDSYTDKVSLVDYFPFLSKLNGLFRVTPTLRRERNELYDLFWRNVSEHQKTFDKRRIRDFIDTFLDEIRIRKKTSEVENGAFNARQLVATLVIILFGSNISVPVTLSVLMSAFTTHPEVQEKVREEVDRVIGRDRMPTYNDVRNMPYTEAAISEAIRRGDMSPLGTYRTPPTNEKISILGYQIPRDSIVVGNFSKIHFDPLLWKDPTGFNPENFLDDDGNFANHEHFMPFGAGRRICPGLMVGKIELFIITTALLQHFTFHKLSAAQLEESRRIGYSQHVTQFQIVAKNRIC